MQKWSEYVELLKQAEPLIDQTTAPVDEQLRADMYRQFAMGLSQAYFLTFMMDPRYPEFIPFENSAFLAQPNPDGIYHACFLDGAGTYKITGERGNCVVAGFATGKKIFGLQDEWGQGFDNYDVDSLDIDADGKFEVIFSEHKPEGWTGNWLYLNPEVDFLMLRQFHYNWGRDVDMRVAVERLDPMPPRPRMSPEEVSAKLTQVMHYPRRLTTTALLSMRRPHDEGFINKAHLHNFQDLGNGDSWPQTYFEMVFDLSKSPDDVLVLETDLPQNVKYWNVQVIDGLWNQVDILYRQSSLNGATAKVDTDGKFRAVLCAKDPGYANWLDTGDHPYGMLIGRWYKADSHPVPDIKVMKRSELEAYLGDRSPRISAEDRAAAMRERLIGSQLRRKW